MAFVVPPYPYERLDPVKRAASATPGGLIDLSIGTPCDAPPAEVISALSSSGAERGYPTSLGSEALRKSVAQWISRRLHVSVDPNSQVAACIGTKEFVGTTPGYLKLLRDNRDTVLYPEVSYPTYEMGAHLAGLRAVAVPMLPSGGTDLSAVSPSDAARALCLWVNSPANPSGGLDDLAAAARWGESNDVWVLSDECYSEFSWASGPTTILSSSQSFKGLLAVHSLSKRSNLAGVRVGCYAGDPQLVHHLSEVRKHAGFMVPGPVQFAAAVAYSDDSHVDKQRMIYRDRLETLLPALVGAGFEAEFPQGAFYLWAKVPTLSGQPAGAKGDAWKATAWLAERTGILVSPGDFYGSVSGDRIRLAVVQPDDKIEQAAKRLSEAGTYE